MMSTAGGIEQVVDQILLKKITWQITTGAIYITDIKYFASTCTQEVSLTIRPCIK